MKQSVDSFIGPLATTIRCLRLPRVLRRSRSSIASPVDLVLSDLHLPPHVDDLSEGLAIIEVARIPPVSCAGDRDNGKQRKACGA